MDVLAAKPRSQGSTTLSKGIGVLSAIAGTGRPLRFADLQRKTGLPKATLHRLLSTLIEEGLVRFQASDRTYRLGMRLFEMAHHVWESFDLRGTAIDEMTRLCDSTGETVSLGMLNDGEVVYIDELTGSHHIRTRMRLGRRDPAYCTAIGKAILSVSAQDELDRFFERIAIKRFTEYTVTDRDQLRFDLNLVGARGYAVEQNEHISGISGVAAPVIDHRGQAVAAIGLFGPSSRLEIQRLHELGPPLMEACWRVSVNAGGTPKSVSSVQRPTEKLEPGLYCVVAAKALIGEAPAWCQRTQRLFWVDLAAPALHISDPRTGVNETIPLPEIVGGLAVAGPGRLILAMQSGLAIFDTASRTVTDVIGHPEPEVGSNRFSGGRCDRQGRFWTSTADYHGIRARGSLYRLNARGNITRMESNLQQPNGLGWSPDGSIMYFADTLKRTIYAYDFDPGNGEISNRREFVRFPDDKPQMPTGIAIDSVGYLWCAIWDGWCLHRYTPEGALDHVAFLGVPRPTSCQFGGPALQTLYITTARIRIANDILTKAPISGSVLGLECSISGLPEQDYSWERKDAESFVHQNKEAYS